MTIQTNAQQQQAREIRGGTPPGTLDDYRENPTASGPKLRAGDVLAPAFAMTFGTWITAYVVRIPLIQDQVNGPTAIALMLGVVFIAGILTGRYSRKGAWAALLAGCISGVLDVLILGSLLHDETGRKGIVPAAAIWFGGSVLINGVAAGLGGAIGMMVPSKQRQEIRWTAVFAAVLAAATLPLITAGGLVTAFHAGLAVPDWPQSYGYNMFLFPLSRMQAVQGNFLEHAHRLMGALVGLTVTTVAVYFTVAFWRGWRGLAQKANWRTWMAWGLFVAVCVQGVLGGTRVTEKSETLAIAHGVFAQIVFAGMALLAGVSTRDFERIGQLAGGETREQRTDRWLTAGLLAAMLVQLTLGAIVRHLNALVIIHVSMAAVVTILALAAGFRAIWMGDQAVGPGAGGGRKFAGAAVLLLVALAGGLGYRGAGAFSGGGQMAR